MSGWFRFRVDFGFGLVLVSGWFSNGAGFGVRLVLVSGLFWFGLVLVSDQF